MHIVSVMYSGSRQ